MTLIKELDKAEGSGLETQMQVKQARGRANSPLLLYPSTETSRQVTAERHLNTYFGQANMVQSDVHGSGSDKAMREEMDRKWRKLAEDEASCWE